MIPPKNIPLKIFDIFSRTEYTINKGGTASNGSPLDQVEVTRLLRAGGLLLFVLEDGLSDHPAELKDSNENKGVLKHLIPVTHIFHPLLMERGKEAFFRPFPYNIKDCWGANRQNALDLSTTYVTPFGVTTMILYFAVFCN